MNQQAVDVLTRALPVGLGHPGDENTPSRIVAVPGFRTTGMPDDQAQEFVGERAKLLAESVVHTIESAGITMIPTAELDQLRQDAADAPDGTRVIQICTTVTDEPVLMLTVTKAADRVVVPASVLKAVGANL